MTDMTLDLDGYFERIDYHGAAEPTLGVLQDLITAHTRTIPFENLDPLLGVPIDDLSPEALNHPANLRRDWRTRLTGRKPTPRHITLDPGTGYGGWLIGLVGHQGFCGTPRHGLGMLGCGGSAII